MKKSKSKSRSIENVYQKKTHMEHILLRPDTYIGSTDNCEESLFVFCKENNAIVKKKIAMNWGLYKIFDEIMVNAADNSQRKSKMSFINVQIKKSTGEIIIENDGEGIPIVFHKKQKVYVPEMIFGMLLSGSNFDDSIKKTVGGRNGYGCKLANIFSKSFEVTIHDKKRGKKYVQKWSNNMSQKSEPEITDITSSNQNQSSKTKSTKENTLQEFMGSSKRRQLQTLSSEEESVECSKNSISKNLVRICFKPDFEKFNLRKIPKDLYALMHKRVIDIKTFVGKDVRVTFNKKVIKCKSFKDYIKLHLKTDQFHDEIKIKKIRNGLEIGLAISSEGFKQVSMVNGINTLKGGSHVKYVMEQLIEGLTKQVKKQKINNLKPFVIKNSIFIFINCLVENPVFSSQTKEVLKSRKDQLSYLKLSDSFIKEICKFETLVKRIVAESKIRESNALTRAMNMKSISRKDLLKINKLEDANWAGTKKSHHCTLILTEGDSAKSLAMAGLDVVGRDQWGVFPLRGKLINVRNAKMMQIKNNTEIKNIMTIMGLIMGKDYSTEKSRKELRYGSLMIMADQDVDGSHIKGLIINFVLFFWPSLLKIKGFIRQFITPLIKVNFNVNAKILKQSTNFVRSGIFDKTTKKLVFFSLPDFKLWYEDESIKKDIKSIKYYKGLGTSTDKEARNYFKNIDSHVKKFFYSGKECVESLEMAFALNQITNRKIWLTSTNANQSLDYSHIKSLSYKEFVNNELIQFSLANLGRSIPNVLDGLKSGKRKILFSCFKRNLINEIKVAQLSGYVAEHSAYHHGEMSLNKTIINMAQDFVGSNNLNLLDPIGQFGSRYASGDEAASPRYIYTRLAKLTRFLFRSDDDPLLLNIEEEGQVIEPLNYMPIVPYILINGSEGIGTGWSTYIPKYDVLDLINNIRRKLKGKSFQWIKPYYRNFLGKIRPHENKEKCKKSDQFGNSEIGWDAIKFTCSGILKQTSSNTLDIFELPLGSWTRKYKQFLSNLIQNDELDLQNYKEFHTRTTIHFHLIFKKSAKINLKKKKAFWMKKLKLTTSINLSNLVLFNAKGKLTHYNNVLEIISDFYVERYKLYQKEENIF
jgi:DNA topoisomerase-2